AWWFFGIVVMAIDIKKGGVYFEQSLGSALPLEMETVTWFFLLQSHIHCRFTGDWLMRFFSRRLHPLGDFVGIINSAIVQA
ncbi:hypothetical protein Nepgr_021815, partial [Nepenthes gracilis]